MPIFFIPKNISQASDSRAAVLAEDEALLHQEMERANVAEQQNGSGNYLRQQQDGGGGRDGGEGKEEYVVLITFEFNHSLREKVIKIGVFLF